MLSSHKKLHQIGYYLVKKYYLRGIRISDHITLIMNVGLRRSKSITVFIIQSIQRLDLQGQLKNGDIIYKICTLITYVNFSHRPNTEHTQLNSLWNVYTSTHLRLCNCKLVIKSLVHWSTI